jgi:hypothetical protein
MSNLTRLTTRRDTIRAIAGGGLALAAGWRWTNTADAARRWCFADPVLRIDGQTVHVYISSDVEMLRSATDKIRLIVTLPSGVRGRLTDIESDFGEGYDVDFAESRQLSAADDSIAMRIAVYCPARNSDLPVNVEVAPIGDGRVQASSASGTANQWIRFTAG